VEESRILRAIEGGSETTRPADTDCRGTFRDSNCTAHAGSGPEAPRGARLTVEGMPVRGKRRLIIPPEPAYGATGTSNGIPGNAGLVFEMELLDVR